MAVAVTDLLANRAGSNRRELLVLAAILLMALALRLYGLDAESLWRDEGHTLLRAVDAHLLGGGRPLFYLFMKWWMGLGSSDAWLRLPAVAFGVAGIAALWAATKAAAGPHVAMLACALMALAVPEIDHSQEVRMYTLTSFLTAAAAAVLVRWDGRRWTTLLAFGALSWLALLASPVAAIGLAAWGLGIFLIRRWDRRALGRLLVAAVLLGLCWAHWARAAPAMVERVGGGEKGWTTAPGPRQFLTLPASLLVNHVGFPGRSRVNLVVSGMIVMSSLGLLAAAALGCRDRESRHAPTFALAFVVSAGTVFVVSRLASSVWVPRYFTALAPVLYVALAAGLVVLTGRRRWLAAVTTVALTGALAFSLAHYYREPTREDWRGVAVWLRGRVASGDVVCLLGPGNDFLFARYFGAATPTATVRVPSRRGQQLTAEQALALVAGHRSVSGRTWLVVVEGPSVRAGSMAAALARLLSRRLENFDSFQIAVVGLPPTSPP